MDSVFDAGKYVSWGVVSISLTNLLVILAMVVIFVLALVIPFPHDHESPPDGGDASCDGHPNRGVVTMELSALLPFATGRARAGDWLCAAVSLSLVLGYVAYWADGIMYGPRYFYEASGCLALLTARGVLIAADITVGTTQSLLRRRAPPRRPPSS